MTERRDPFDDRLRAALDDVPAPDLWDAATDRERPERPLPSGPSPGRRVAIAAFALTAGGGPRRERPFRPFAVGGGVPEVRRGDVIERGAQTVIERVAPLSHRAPPRPAGLEAASGPATDGPSRRRSWSRASGRSPSLGNRRSGAGPRTHAAWATSERARRRRRATTPACRTCRREARRRRSFAG